MTRSRKFITLRPTLLAISLFLSTQANALPDFLEPAKISGEIKKAVASASIGAKVKLLDAALYDGVTTALQYRIESEPSYINGFYTRFDKYKFNVNVNPMDWIEGYDSPIGFGVRKNTEVLFARQFKSQSESITALPYTFLNFPINAKRAVEKLNPGDFIAFESDLNLVLSAGTSTLITNHFPLSISGNIYVSGNFMVHMFRMPEDKIRVKFIALRGKGSGLSLGAGYDKKLEISGFKYLDKRISKWINLNPLSIGSGKSKNDLFMIDFVFDLKSIEAAAAYDDLVGSQLKFKDVAIANPFATKEDLKNALVKDLTRVEEIVHEDETRKSNEKRIYRVFKGSNSMSSSSSFFKIGLNILRFESGTLYTQNKVVSIDDQENENKYLFDTFNVDKSRKSFFGTYLHNHTVATSLLFKADERFNPAEFVTLTLAREMRMSNFDKKDLSEIQNQVKRTLPPEVYANIDWKNWSFPKGNVQNVFFRSEIFFKPEALEEMPSFSIVKLEEKIRAYLASRPRPETSPTQNIFNLGEYKSYLTWVDQYDEDINYIAKRISSTFEKNLTYSERYKAFIGLKNNDLFQEIGAGLLLFLLPKEKINEIIGYQLILEGKGQPSVEFKYGDIEQEELYRNLLYIQRVLNSRSIDLRLYMDDKK